METTISSGPNKDNPTHLGIHYMAEFFDANRDILKNATEIEDIMREAALIAGATVLSSNK